MQLNLLSFSTAVQNSAAAVQASCAQLLDLTIGSVLRAILEANAGLVMWLQFLILQVLSAIRAATSAGSDLDTWVADFGLTRLPATFASGTVTFSRFTATNSALIPLGAPVKTADGSQTFNVGQDTTNPYWVLGGYLIPAGVASASFPVTAAVGGVAGNVTAGTITLIATAISGVDTVSNASAFTNAAAAESDAALRTRFAAYIASLPRSTLAAIRFAISSVQQNLVFSVTENYTRFGVWQPGYFTVVVDDGTGSPPTTTLNAVAAAVEQYRAATIQYGVFGPTVLTANVSMTLTTATGYTHSLVAAAVQTAITVLIDAVGFGGVLPFNQLAQVAFNTPGVANVSAILLNGATADLTATSGQVIRAGTVAIS